MLLKIMLKIIILSMIFHYSDHEFMLKIMILTMIFMSYSMNLWSKIIILSIDSSILVVKFMSYSMNLWSKSSIFTINSWFRGIYHVHSCSYWPHSVTTLLKINILPSKYWFLGQNHHKIDDFVEYNRMCSNMIPTSIHSDHIDHPVNMVHMDPITKPTL